jgi:lipopolysaccharide biosynthesis regulator YciM
MWPQPLQTIINLIHQPHIWGLLISFVVGFIIGRVFSSRKAAKTKKTSRKGDEDFFKGIRYILSNENDQAIEEFTPQELLWQCPQCRKWDTMTRKDEQPVPSDTAITDPLQDNTEDRAAGEGRL